MTVTPTPNAPPQPPPTPAHPWAPLTALCAVARFHQIAADPATLAHQLGLSASQPLTTADLLTAAKHLGLKAKLSRTRIERLSLTPLPALAFMRTAQDATTASAPTSTPPLHIAILAQSDGQRVLVQEMGTDHAAPASNPSTPLPHAGAVSSCSSAARSAWRVPRPGLISPGSSRHWSNTASS